MIYLTEKLLVEFYKTYFPNNECLFNKKIIKHLNFRPDICDFTLKRIIEFDGYLHYTKASTIVLDEYKDKEYAKLGFKTIRIPYFIQLTNQISQKLFNITQKEPIDYPHGFIDDKVILPSNFCSAGIDRFIIDVEKNFLENKQDIINSLQNKLYEIKYDFLTSKQEKDIILPEKLHHWLK